MSLDPLIGTSWTGSSCLETFGVITNEKAEKEMNRDELTATWSQGMFMLLFPWRHALLISVIKYDFQFIGQWLKGVKEKNSVMTKNCTLNPLVTAVSWSVHHQITTLWLGRTSLTVPFSPL